MQIRIAILLVTCILTSSCATPSLPADEAVLAQLEREVAAAERGFAKSMADRDLAAFASFIADDASFRGPKTLMHGKSAVVAGWKRFFSGPQAPFSWDPDQVSVQSSGRLAISTGPVRDPDGKLIARFVSVWRKHSDGSWRVVLDQGVPACN